MTIMLVGDSDQLLYRFQGANPEFMTDEIERHLPDITTIKLDVNYRSTDTIINACQRLIAHNYSDLGGPYSQEFMKDVSGIKGEGEDIQYSFYPNVEDESKGCADGILEQLQAGYEPGDFFVGARTRAQLGYLEGALTRAGIKFINIAGGSFWQSKHVADVIAYLRLSHNLDPSALQRVYNIPSANHQYAWNDKRGRFKAGDYCPTRYLGREFLAKIGNDFNQIDNVLFGSDGWRYKTKDQDYSTYGPTKAQDLQEFVWRLQQCQLEASNQGQIVNVIINDCYEKYLRVTEGLTSTDESENGKLEDLKTVEDIASEYETAEEFLAFVDEMIEAAQNAKDGDWDDYVVISTYHRLKGLERKVVFGLGWCEGYSLLDDMPRGLLPHTFSLVRPPNFGVLPGSGKSPVEDERCIAFVCVSRAKEKVFLSGCETYRDWIMQPSRFIKEMGL